MDGSNNTFNNNQSNEKVEMNNAQNEAVQATVEPVQTNSFAANDVVSNQAAPNYTYEQSDNTVADAVVLENEKKSNSKSTTAMIFGIVSAASIWLCCCFPISIVFGIISIITAIKAKKLSSANKFNGKCIAALICSIAGLVISLLTILLFVIMFLAALADPEVMNEVLAEYGYEIVF